MVSSIASREAPKGRVALFARQGYAAAHFGPFVDGFARYHLVGLSTEEVQQVCDTSGIDSNGFEDELGRLNLALEAGNPGVLQTLINLFRKNGRLPETRTQAITAMVEYLSMLDIGLASSRRGAARALALAMELASRNYLSPVEAELAIAAGEDVSPPEAKALLGSVSPLLLFTTQGIAFPHQSFGEFFAAGALRNRPLSLVLDAIFLPRTRIINPSWRPSLGILAEMHGGMRRYLAFHHPDVALAASPSVFSDAERLAISQNLYARLRRRRETLIRHPEVGLSRLARFLPPSLIATAEADASQQADPTLASNAFLVLGESGAQQALPLALATALDRKVSQLIRDGAFYCLQCLGDASLIPQLVSRVDSADPCYVLLQSCLGALMDVVTIPIVMPVLLASSTRITSARERLRRLEPKSTASAVLELVRRQPSLIEDFHWQFYGGFLPTAPRRGWADELAAAVAEMLLALSMGVSSTFRTIS